MLCQLLNNCGRIDWLRIARYRWEVVPMLRTAREDAQHQKDEAGFHIDTYVCRRQKYRTGGGCHGTRWKGCVRR
ncbi:hypothetical protein RC91_18960 [Pectobacterium brasiliense]|nr:hypothetical protein NC16_06815 [Pectobacterium brasiliense]KHS98800.1 hypothetical protein RC91_18960 [Pectobacterium brasiliense]